MEKGVSLASRFHNTFIANKYFATLDVCLRYLFTNMVNFHACEGTGRYRMVDSKEIESSLRNWTKKEEKTYL